MSCVYVNCISKSYPKWSHMPSSSNKTKWIVVMHTWYVFLSAVHLLPLRQWLQCQWMCYTFVTSYYVCLLGNCSGNTQCQRIAVNDKFHLLDVGLKHLLVTFQEEYQTRLQAPKLAAKEQSILWFIAQKVVQNFQAPLTLYTDGTRAPKELSNSVKRYIVTVHIGTYYKTIFTYGLGLKYSSSCPWAEKNRTWYSVYVYMPSSSILKVCVKSALLH